MSKPNVVICTTRTLSRAVDAILAHARPPGTTKSALLNIIAATIAGPRHNWGFLVGAEHPVVAKDLTTDDLNRALVGMTPALSPETTSGEPAGEARDPNPGTRRNLPEAGARPRRHPVTGDLLADTRPLDDGAIAVTMHDETLPGTQATPIHVQLAAEDTAGLFLALVREDRLAVASYRAGNAEFQVLQGRLLVRQLESGTGQPLVNRIDHAKLHRDLLVAFPLARASILAGRAGSAALTAFVMVAETQTEIQDALGEGLITDQQVDDAVALAAVRYLVERPGRREFLDLVDLNGNRMVTDDILDREWTLLTEILGLNDA